MEAQRFDWDGREARALARELRALQPSLSEVAGDVAAIIEDVAARGDEAALEAERRFGAGEPSAIRVPDEAVTAALEGSSDLRPHLEAAADSIRAVAVAEAGAEPETSTEGPFGQHVEMRSVPVASAGVYVPGGKASYPSSVLMGCLAARAAGVPRVVVVTPPGPEGVPGQAVLAACAVAGADAVYALGGAQAIAALALGTDTVEAVDVVVGPGNRFVQEAKRQLYGRIGIEGIAGPSELMVIAGPGSSARTMALDLCAQAEHGPDGLLVAASTDRSVVESIESEVGKLEGEAGRAVSEAALALVTVPDEDAAIELANALAPEHLELVGEEVERRAGDVRYAGCVFVGEQGATAFGDYAAGSNHILPTGGAGRFTGPLGPRAFRRRIATVRVPGDGVAALAEVTDTLARAEGFPIHGESALARMPAAEPEDSK